MANDWDTLDKGIDALDQIVTKCEEAKFNYFHGDSDIHDFEGGRLVGAFELAREIIHIIRSIRDDGSGETESN
jgi:hypothetical protein